MPEMTIKPDQAFLQDPATVYPVTIDPSFSIHPQGDTWIDNVANQTSQGSSEDLARIIHAHPTLSEAVHEAAMSVDKRAIHKMN